MFSRKSLPAGQTSPTRGTPSVEDTLSAGRGSPTKVQPQNLPNARYGWNEHYNIWELFSEEGKWLGLSATFRPPPSQLKSFDDRLAEGILDLSQLEEGPQEVDLDGQVLDHPKVSAEISVSPKGITPTSDGDNPTGRNEGFIYAPLGFPPFGFDLMAARPTKLGRDASVWREYAMTRSTKPTANSNSNRKPIASATFVDSSPPVHDGNDDETNTLERSSRDIIRPSADSGRDTLTRKRCFGVMDESNDANTPPYPRKRPCTMNNAATPRVEPDLGPRDTNGHPFILLDPQSVERLEGDGVRPGRHKMQTSFHVDPDTHPALIELSKAEKERMWQTSTGAQRGPPTTPNGTARKRALPVVEVTMDDLRTHSVTVCRSLADMIHQQRVLNLRRDLYNSMTAEYSRWRRAGGLEAWRAARAEMTAAERATEAHKERLVREGETPTGFDPPGAGGQTAGPDDAMPSVERDDGGEENGHENEEQVLRPLDEPSERYTGWGRQWFNISNTGR